MEETVILNFEIDQTQAQKNLIQTEKNILSLKKEQQELNKAYKEGKKTEEQYIREKLRLDKAIKTEQESSKKLNQVLNTVSNSLNAQRLRLIELKKSRDDIDRSTEEGVRQFNKLTREIKKLNDEIKESEEAGGDFRRSVGEYVKSVNIAGVSVGDLTGKMSSFLNPATAAVGVLAALGTAYAASSSGAKDLAFAQDRLTFITSSLSETLGTLVSGSGEGGEGILNKALDGFLNLAKNIPGVNVALLALQATTGVTIDSINAQSKALAQAREDLRNLEIEAARAQGFAKLFENAAENARRLRDEEERILEERLKAADTVEANLLANQQVRINVINQEIEAIKKANVNWQNQNAIVLQIEQKRAETRDIEEEINGKLTENFTARKKIRDEITALARAEQRARTPLDATTGDPLQGAFATELDNEAEIQDRFNKRLIKTQKETSDEITRQKRREAEARIALEKMVNEQTLGLMEGFAGVAASLFDQQSEEYKAFASFQTLISTYSTAQKAYEAAFVPPTVASPALGAANVALAIAQGLANLAAINGVQFAEGGFTGQGGKYEPAGIVHKGEYVAPQHVVNSPVAQPHIQALESMRLKGYADGGFVTQQNISASQQSLIIANAMKNLPPIYASWSEGQKIGRQLQIKESVAKL